MHRKTTFILSGLLLAATSCVNVDPETGKTIPRGDQRYEFAEVERQAENLQVGMSQYDVLMLLGSPAEKEDRGEVWIYLPERAAVLLPARALRLEFSRGRLVEHGYSTIVLGTKL